MRIPEITLNSQFGSFISNFIFYNTWIKNVVEIGSGSGDGSTQCFIKGLYNRKNASLTCIESNPSWFSDLKENTRDYSFVKCINKSSISYDNLLVKTFEEYLTQCSKTIEYEYRRKWYDQDILFFKDTKIGEGGIETDEKYDCVLIDGSEFSGYSEYLLIKNRTKCIMLDDINEFKCFRVHEELSSDDNWELVHTGPERNGFSCFVKIK